MPSIFSLRGGVVMFTVGPPTAIFGVGTLEFSLDANAGELHLELTLVSRESSYDLYCCSSLVVAAAS